MSKRFPNTIRRFYVYLDTHDTDVIDFQPAGPYCFVDEVANVIEAKDREITTLKAENERLREENDFLNALCVESDTQ